MIQKQINLLPEIFMLIIRQLDMTLLKKQAALGFSDIFQTDFMPDFSVIRKDGGIYEVITGSTPVMFSLQRSDGGVISLDILPPAGLKGVAFGKSIVALAQFISEFGTAEERVLFTHIDCVNISLAGKTASQFSDFYIHFTPGADLKIAQNSQHFEINWVLDRDAAELLPTHLALVTQEGAPGSAVRHMGPLSATRRFLQQKCTSKFCIPFKKEELVEIWRRRHARIMEVFLLHSNLDRRAIFRQKGMFNKVMAAIRQHVVETRDASLYDWQSFTKQVPEVDPYLMVSKPVTLSSEQVENASLVAAGTHQLVQYTDETSTIFRSGNTLVVFDAGAPFCVRTLEQILRSDRNREIQYVMIQVSHFHDDHVSYLEQLVKKALLSRRQVELCVGNSGVSQLQMHMLTWGFYENWSVEKESRVLARLTISRLEPGSIYTYADPDSPDLCLISPPDRIRHFLDSYGTGTTTVDSDGRKTLTFISGDINPPFPDVDTTLTVQAIQDYVYQAAAAAAKMGCQKCIIYMDTGHFTATIPEVEEAIGVGTLARLRIQDKWIDIQLIGMHHKSMSAGSGLPVEV